jgi:hypothetical protein
MLWSSPQCAYWVTHGEKHLHHAWTGKLSSTYSIHEYVRWGIASSGMLRHVALVNKSHTV